jgi:hypothetical protein
MPTNRQNQYLPQLHPILGQIASINPESIVQREKLGSELSFELILPLVVEIVSAARGLQKTNLDRIPYGLLSGILSAFQQINQLLVQIMSFSPTQHGNAIQARDSYAMQIEDQWNGLFSQVRMILGSQDDDVAKSQIEALAAQVRTTVQLSSDAADSLRSKQQEIDHMLAKFLEERKETFDKEGAEKLKIIDHALNEVRKAAVEAGVSQTSKYFHDEASEHLKTSFLWLGATGLSILLLVLFSLLGTSLLTYLGNPQPLAGAEGVEHIRYLAQKGLIVFCLIFALILSAKNYGAARHNYVVNKHRNNALSSFQAFAASATDDQTKSAVLIQATQSIFSPQASGYVKTDGDNSPQTPVIEILRSVGGKDS